MTIANGQFHDLNAARRQHPKLTRIHPGVVRRNHPEPDRSHVEGALPEPVIKPSEVPEMAAKKKRAKVDANTRAVAVARVEKLIAADNPVSKATASVAKELGVSESAITNWRTAAKKAPKPAKKARGVASNGTPAAAIPRDALATEVLSAFAAWLDAGVREVVRQEIRRMLA